MNSQLQKLAADMPAVLGAAADHLEKMAHDNTALLNQNVQLQHELSAYKLARRMEQRGLSSELDFEAKVASLLEMPSEKLASLDSAIELASGGFRLGSIEQDQPAATGEFGRQPDPLDSYISSNASYQ